MCPSDNNITYVCMHVYLSCHLSGRVVIKVLGKIRMFDVAHRLLPKPTNIVQQDNIV